MRTITRIGITIVGVAFVLSIMAPTAEARRAKRPSSWVPNKAWKAVKKYAQKRYDPRAKLFKTTVTKSQSRGLRGSNGKAWIVGAALPKRTQPPGVPRQGFMPYKPANTYFLVTRGSGNQYSVTPLAGMGGYMSKVDAKADNARVGVGVGLYSPGQVGHGIEVSNARKVSVTKGQALAQKRRGTKHTVFVKGDTGGQQWAIDAKANLKASIRPDGWCATPINKDIPVHFSQVMFARPMGPMAHR